jgi:hypothetical protein
LLVGKNSAIALERADGKGLDEHGSIVGCRIVPGRTSVWF